MRAPSAHKVHKFQHLYLKNHKGHVIYDLSVVYVCMYIYMNINI